MHAINLEIGGRDGIVLHMTATTSTRHEAPTLPCTDHALKYERYFFVSGNFKYTFLIQKSTQYLVNLRKMKCHENKQSSGYGFDSSLGKYLNLRFEDRTVN